MLSPESCAWHQEPASRRSHLKDGRWIYRTGEFSYVRDPYAEFMDSPDEELMAPLRELLRRDGGFIAVVEAGSALKPDTLVEISM